ncbi:hypothetical protein F383_33820 [Gossypium arboreum]|uniref:Uncharacterized protein n=1 Tax=Gossypium arboreum TaxID=29729 RepID=A0A0B0N0P1_GOSAR|nr:hypothetical protein F383_33820 [Gossypium arboreum]
MVLHVNHKLMPTSKTWSYTITQLCRYFLEYLIFNSISHSSFFNSI